MIDLDRLIEIAKEAPQGRWSEMNRRGLADVRAHANGTTGAGELVAICYLETDNPAHNLNDADIERAHRSAEYIAAMNPQTAQALLRELAAAREVVAAVRAIKTPAPGFYAWDQLDNNVSIALYAYEAVAAKEGEDD